MWNASSNSFFTRFSDLFCVEAFTHALWRHQKDIIISATRHWYNYTFIKYKLSAEMLHTWLLILRLGDTKYAWYKGCHLINVMSLPDQDLCSIDQTIACLHLPALPWDAAAWNMDGGQEAIFHCRCSLTSPHFAHILCCLWLVRSIQLRNQQQGFFCCVCLFVCLCF